MAILSELFSNAILSLIAKILMVLFVLVFLPALLFQCHAISVKNKKIAELKIEIKECRNDLTDLGDITGATERDFQKTLNKYGERIEKMCREAIKKTDEELDEDRLKNLFVFPKENK